MQWLCWPHRAIKYARLMQQGIQARSGLCRGFERVLEGGPLTVGHDEPVLIAITEVSARFLAAALAADGGAHCTASTEICPASWAVACGLIMISTSWLSTVRNSISFSTENWSSR